MEKKYLVRTVNNQEPTSDGNVNIISVGGVIDVTRDELINLISGELLSPGSTYKISNAHVGLYNDGTDSGTTIYLKALTNKTLSVLGDGEFFNPIYLDIEGFGIFGSKTSPGGTLERSNIFTTGLAPYGSSGGNMSFDTSGNIFNSGNTGIITKTTPQGITTVFAEDLTDQFKALPFAISKLNNNLYCLIKDSNKIVKITPEGLKSDFATLDATFEKLYMDQDNNLFIWNANTNNIYSIDVFGQQGLFRTVTNPIIFKKNSNDESIVLKSDGQVVKISPFGDVTVLFTVPDTNYSDMVLDSQDNIYVTANGTDPDDISEKNLYRYDGSSVKVIYTTTKNLCFLKVDRKDTIYLTTHYTDSLVKINKNLAIETIERTDEGNTWNSILIDDNDDIFIQCENNIMLRYLGKNYPFGQFLEAEANSPQNIIFDKNRTDNEMLFTSLSDNKVLRLSRTGFVSNYVNVGNGPKFIKQDSLGNTFVYNSIDKTISKISYLDDSVTVFADVINEDFTDMVIDKFDNILLCRPYNPVKKVTSLGVVSNLGGNVSQADSLISNSFGDVFISNYSERTIHKTTSAGVTTVFVTSSQTISDLTISESDILYALREDGSVMEIQMDGSFVVIEGFGPTPTSIYYTNKSLYTVAFSSNTLYSMPLSTRIPEFLSAEITHPVDLIANGFEEIFILNNNSISKFEYIVTPFNISENITADNGAKGRLISDFNDSSISPVHFNIISGDWSTAKSIVGDDTDAKSIIKNVILQPIYLIGDKTIWGGYSWTNLTGNHGVAEDNYTLNEDWSKDIYSEDDYKKSLDIIEYDIENDWISRRYESKNSNNIVFTFKDSLIFDGLGSAIRSFQFGNGLNLLGFGTFSNDSKNSFFETINFSGQFVRNNKISEMSTFRNISNFVTFIFNEMINSKLTDINFQDGNVSQNIFNSSVIRSQTIGGIGNSNFLTTNIFNIDTPPLLNGIDNSIFNNVTMNENDLSEATVFFDTNIIKYVYRRPDGISKIRYYDNNDIQVISDINA